MEESVLDNLPHIIFTQATAQRIDIIAPLLELGKKLCKGTKFTAEPSQSILLGGVTVVCESSGIACDCSFDTSLAQQRQNFTKAAGLSKI